MPYKLSPYVKKKIFGSSEELPVQRVIIPQGLVNPHEITIIEIPQNLQDVPAVVAKPRENDDSYSNFFPVTCSTVKSSQLFPKDSNVSASLGASQYSVSPCVSQAPLQTRTASKTSYPLGANIGIRCRSSPRTAHPRMLQMYEGGVSYGGMPPDFSPNRSGTFYEDYIQNYTPIVGSHNESEEIGYDYSDPRRRAIGFDPYVHGEAVKRQFSPYINNEPPARSTPQGYQQSAESYLNAMDYAAEESCQPSYLVPNPPLTPYQRKSPQSGLIKVLDNLDVVELSRIKNDLKNFQLARRKLLFDASKLKH